MDHRLKYFLLAAEEMNMRKAAEKAFISPQGMSAAIKSLERQYDTVLFTRSPKLILTPQGEALKNAVRQIKTIEDNVAAILSENKLDFCDKITLGILESRYEIAIPDIASAFLKQYPHVKLDVVSGYSRDLEYQTEKQQMDLFIGPDGRYPPNLTSIPLLDEKFALLITQNMLEKYFDGITKAEIDTMKKGIELKDFAHVPLIQYPNYTKFYHAIARYEEENTIHFLTAFESNHALSHSRFVQKNIGMAIVPTLFLPRVAEQNTFCRPEDYVHAFPVNTLPYHGVLNLVYCKNRYLTRCHIHLIDIILTVFEEYSHPNFSEREKGLLP